MVSPVFPVPFSHQPGDTVIFIYMYTHTHTHTHIHMHIHIYAVLEFLLFLSGQTEGKFPFLTRNRQFLDDKLLIKHNMVSVIP